MENEEIKSIRSKELAIIKASNEMLEQAKETMLSQGIGDEKIIEQISDAQKENLAYAMTRHGATEEEVSKSRYHGASVKAMKQYKKRLESRGLTDEMVHRKQIATTTLSGASKPEKKERVAGVGYIGDAGVQPGTDSGTVKKRRVRKTKSEKEKTDGAIIKNLPNDDLTNAHNSVTEFIETVSQDAPEVKVGGRMASNGDESYSVDNLNLDSIPDYVQYDIIPLPSNGQCYSHKKGRLPVGYLTAADENIIASPNMYRDGKILDVLLRRKVLDKSVNTDELCEGDRDAIILWLRATSYGDDYPIYATNPATGNKIETSIKLSEFKYFDFDLEGDENGCFDYTLSNGDVIKFKFLTHNQESELINEISNEITDTNKVAILKAISNIKESLEYIEVSDEDSKNVLEDLDEIASVVGTNFTRNLDSVFTTAITKRMNIHTYSINGNTDRDYIKSYIDNMRSNDAFGFRQYINDHKPGVDFRITVNVPESDGGGSFATFLKLEDTVFLNS